MPSLESKPKLRRAKASAPAGSLRSKKSSAPQSATATAEAAEYFALLGRATNDAVRDWEVKSGRLSWPRGLESLLGYDGSNGSARIEFWLDRVHPNDLARIQQSLHDTLAGPEEHWTGEYQFRRADGEYIYVFERALITRCPDPHFIGIMMDVTARQQLQTQACRSQRMEAFGQLAGGLAHDFNNFLTTILGYSDLLLLEKSIQGSVASHLHEIRAAAARASALTNQLLAFSRRQALEPTVIEINTLITDLERSLLRLLGENISVACQLHHLKGGVHIRADADQITQIILNLAVNARDAMRKGGRLTITTSAVQMSEEGAPHCTCSDFTPGEYVAIAVADNGPGMSEEVKARLFEPFFTTREAQQRSGLGLATSYGIVRQSGGHICVESTLGQGTTFRIFLPRVPAPPAAAYKRRPQPKRVTGSETILVLEDDVGVRHLSVRALRHLGYDVIEAARGEDAKRLVAKNGAQPIDLLLTDLVLPEMSGRDFADWLRQGSPQTRVIFISGYLDESLHPGDRRDPAMGFIPKPFTAEELAGKVRQVLDGEDG